MTCFQNKQFKMSVLSLLLFGLGASAYAEERKARVTEATAYRKAIEDGPFKKDPLLTLQGTIKKHQMINPESSLNLCGQERPVGGVGESQARFPNSESKCISADFAMKSLPEEPFKSTGSGNGKATGTGAMYED